MTRYPVMRAFERITTGLAKGRHEFELPMPDLLAVLELEQSVRERLPKAPPVLVVVEPGEEKALIFRVTFQSYSFSPTFGGEEP